MGYDIVSKVGIYIPFRKGYSQTKEKHNIMTISMIGIDHDRAPVDIRALFAFTDENKKEQGKRLSG